MLAFKYNDNLYYESEVTCQKDPLESKLAGHDVWLLPANCTFTPNPDPKDGYKIKYVKETDSWEYEEVVPEPEPEPYVPTEDDKKANVRAIRNSYLQATDYTQLEDAPFTAEEKAIYAEYRTYLRDFTKGDEWWEAQPLTFDEWSAVYYPVAE